MDDIPASYQADHEEDGKMKFFDREAALIGFAILASVVTGTGLSLLIVLVINLVHKGMSCS